MLSYAAIFWQFWRRREGADAFLSRRHNDGGFGCTHPNIFR
jgi:hypothetical protein